MSKPLLIKEFATFEYEKVTDGTEEKKIRRSKYGNMLVRGILQRADTENANGRVYPKDVLKREVENYRKLVNERRALGECVDPETEVLTATGWKFIPNISENELIATLNLSTNEIEYHKINQKIVQDFSGEMLHFTNKKKLDMMLTPNHKMVFWDRHGRPYKRTAHDVELHFDSTLSHSQIKNTGVWKGRDDESFIVGTVSLPTRDFMAFLGLWIADGWTSGCKGGTGQGKFVAVCQQKAHNFEEIDRVVRALGYPVRVDDCKSGKRQWTIHDENLWEYFKNLGNCYTKRIPREALSLSVNHLSTLFDWMLLGDGRNRKDPRLGRLIKEYSTVSPLLAEDVSELVFKLGYGPFIKKHVPQKDFVIEGRVVSKDNCQPIYTVAANTTSTAFDKRFVSIKKVPYNGKVYCVNVKNNTWLMRRNGKVAWTGNCDHADEAVVNLKYVSHVITDIWWEDDIVMGEVEVLEKMDQGKNLAALFEDDIKVGISSRALGSLERRGNVNIVQDDLQLVCWDFVSEPSTPGAFMFKECKEVDPSLLGKIFNKTDMIDRAANEILAFHRALRGEK